MLRLQDMAKVRFELNHQGVAEILKGEKMRSVLEGYARRMAGSEYTPKVVMADTRYLALVSQRNRTKNDNGLLKAMKKA